MTNYPPPLDNWDIYCHHCGIATPKDNYSTITIANIVDGNQYRYTYLFCRECSENVHSSPAMKRRGAAWEY